MTIPYRSEKRRSERGLFRSRRRIVWFTAAVALALASAAGGVSAQDYSEEPFDVEVDSIAPDYPGHDVAAIASALETEVFETADVPYPRDSYEYLLRLEELETTLREKPLYGDLLFGSRLAVVLRNASENDDPDAEEVVCEYEPRTRTATVRRSVKTPRDEVTLWESGTFPPFAAYFSLFRSEKTTYALEIMTSLFKKREPPKLDRWTLVNVEEEDYERFRRSLRVLCVFRLGVGGNEHLGVYEPTAPRSPGALLANEPAKKRPFQLLCAEEVEFWLYDGASGEILAKYSASDAINGRRTSLGKVPHGSVAEKLSSRLPAPPEPPKPGRAPRPRRDPFGPAPDRFAPPPRSPGYGGPLGPPRQPPRRGPGR